MSINRWTDKKGGVYIYITQPIKKNETMPFAATWTDLEIIILSKSERQISYDITRGIKKKWYKWTYLQNRNRLTDKQIYDYQRGNTGKDKLVWDYI